MRAGRLLLARRCASSASASTPAPRVYAFGRGLECQTGLGVPAGHHGLLQVFIPGQEGSAEWDAASDAATAKGGAGRPATAAAAGSVMDEDGTEDYPVGVSAGHYSGAMLTRRGRAYVWGKNAEGALGGGGGGGAVGGGGTGGGGTAGAAAMLATRGGSWSGGAYRASSQGSVAATAAASAIVDSPSPYLCEMEQTHAGVLAAAAAAAAAGPRGPNTAAQAQAATRASPTPSSSLSSSSTSPSFPSPPAPSEPSGPLPIVYLSLGHGAHSTAIAEGSPPHRAASSAAGSAPTSGGGEGSAASPGQQQQQQPRRHLFTCGSAAEGQLGGGGAMGPAGSYHGGQQSSSVRLPSRVAEPFEELGDEPVATAVSRHYTLVLGRSGRLYAMGSEFNGALGVGSTPYCTSPCVVLGLPPHAPGASAGAGAGDRAGGEEEAPADPVVSIAAGLSFSLAATRSGRLFFWGILGHGGTVSVLGGGGGAGPAVGEQGSGLGSTARPAGGTGALRSRTPMELELPGRLAATGGTAGAESRSGARRRGAVVMSGSPALELEQEQAANPPTGEDNERAAPPRRALSLAAGLHHAMITDGTMLWGMGVQRYGSLGLGDGGGDGAGAAVLPTLVPLPASPFPSSSGSASSTPAAGSGQRRPSFITALACGPYSSAVVADGALLIAGRLDSAGLLGSELLAAAEKVMKQEAGPQSYVSALPAGAAPRPPSGAPALPNISTLTAGQMAAEAVRDPSPAFLTRRWGLRAAWAGLQGSGAQGSLSAAWGGGLGGAAASAAAAAAAAPFLIAPMFVPVVDSELYSVPPPPSSSSSPFLPRRAEPLAVALGAAHSVVLLR